ncbi:MAG: hypothetical protein HC798_04365 [Polaribacter sp.]|nr:hypothetical protein [Polaribacter sp.]
MQQLNMIHYLKRHQIDNQKYDDCITKSLQSNIYAFSWYLDIVADNWDVLVLNNYEAVMPLPIRKKWGINYVYQPFWILELGIFSVNKTIDYQSFIDEITKRFRFAEIRLNTENKVF